MIEIYSSDLWKHNPDIICIPTNAIVSGDEAIMGIGVAKEAKMRYPGIQRDLARHIKTFGNIPGLIYTGLQCDVFSFPTKYHWGDKSDLMLIAKSAEKLATYMDNVRPTTEYVLLPRVGCGFGGLKWESVKIVLEQFLDERFFVVSRDEIE